MAISPLAWCGVDDDNTPKPSTPSKERPMTNNPFSMRGKVAVVSGAAQGLGRATALALAQHGADVVLVDRNLAGAEATANAMQGSGSQALRGRTDVSDPAAIDELFRQVDAEFGRVDFLGNIAGDGHLA